MNIMSLNPVSLNGQYEYQEDWVGYLPPGFAETTVAPDEFYATYGFVTPTIEDGVIVSITPNTEALQTWSSTRTEQIRADIDFIAAMQGVNL